ncbi:NRDE family protein [Geomobilimonas luticola]|uniref:NRDE family protein n=1 Tax=Geomobilimonas luticola TaxID=1114878 RepID=A0ABS5SD52_9BACT|nr:NRDE family protein [Geomobilimonas luticola]MBT0653304.1 NRDE family protein [Geomobilimonas luticola]
MCLILFAHDCHPFYRLVLAANRDEFYDRPTAPAAFWDDDPSILAGRDLKVGGTWFGITTTGRLAAITNYRDLASHRPNAPSRGLLVSDFLQSSLPAETFLAELAASNPGYNSFNLVCGTPESLWHYSDRGGPPAPVSHDTHGLSNRLLDTPWPKVSRGKAALADIVQRHDRIEPAELFAILADRTVAADQLLPDTGVGLERERLLSPLHIASADYGTRSATVLLVGRDGLVEFIEQTFNGAMEPVGSTHQTFRLAG